jgi:hypothetical protein
MNNKIKYCPNCGYLVFGKDCDLCGSSRLYGGKERYCEYCGSSNLYLKKGEGKHCGDCGRKIYHYAWMGHEGDEVPPDADMEIEKRDQQISELVRAFNKLKRDLDWLEDKVKNPKHGSHD